MAIDTNVTGVDSSSLSAYKAKTAQLDTKAYSSAASNFNSVNTAKTKAAASPKCPVDPYYSANSDFTMSGNGLTWKQANPPKPPAGTPMAVSAPGTPTLNPGTRGVICGTNVGNANLNLSFECNFVAGIQLDTCLFKFEKVIGGYIEQQAKLLWAKLLQLIPSGDYFKSLAEMICAIASEYQRIICLIQQVISCIMSTISGILQIISWITSLPARFLGMLIDCVTSFFSNITSSLAGMAKALASAFTVSDCQGFECPEISDVSQLSSTVDSIGGGAYAIGNAAGKMV